MNRLWVNRLRDDVPVVGDVLHHLAQSGPFHLLPFQIAQWVRDKIEEDAALPQLLDEQFLLLCRGNIYRATKGRDAGIEWFPIACKRQTTGLHWLYNIKPRYNVKQCFNDEIILFAKLTFDFP